MDTESKLLKWKGIVVHLIHNQTLVHVTVYSLVGVVSSTFNRNRSYLIIVFLILKYLLPANSIGTMGLHQDEERTHTHTGTHTHTYISLEPHYIEQCFQSSPSIHLSRTQSRQAAEYASPLPHNQVSPHTQKHLCFLFFTCSAIVEG